MTKQNSKTCLYIILIICCDFSLFYLTVFTSRYRMKNKLLFFRQKCCIKFKVLKQIITKIFCYIYLQTKYFEIEKKKVEQKW